ncbi:MAG: DUF3501 family protein [Thermoplasmataceae archaeon]|jgi:hypothetical protein|nr:DUF3501 family protein [Candidatus Thermoplasmatota archaeon]
MQSISREDILPPKIYEKSRESITKNIITHKKGRRVISKTFSFLFESRDIVVNQINEMVFIENVQDEEEIKRLIKVYSEQLPGKNELSVSMFIEFESQDVMMRELPKMTGIEDTVYITFDGDELKGIPEEGRSTEVLESTLQYLKFKFDEKNLDSFLKARNAYIETRKKGYEESARIFPDLLESLKSELLSNQK